MSQKEPKPFGSGVFAIVCGGICILLLAISGSIANLRPVTLLRIWFGFAALLLIAWGIGRVRINFQFRKDDITGKFKFDRTIGQDTLNWIVAIVGVAVAIVAFAHDKATTAADSQSTETQAPR